jgi:hypothetical protein
VRVVKNTVAGGMRDIREWAAAAVRRQEGDEVAEFESDTKCRRAEAEGGYDERRP